MKATTFGARLRKLFDVTKMIAADRVENEVVIYLSARDGTSARILMDAAEARELAAQLIDCAYDVETNGY